MTVFSIFPASLIQQAVCLLFMFSKDVIIQPRRWKNNVRNVVHLTASWP